MVDRHEGDGFRAGTVEGGGVALAFRERGAGPPLLLVHDMGRDAEGLEPLARALASSARVLSYDRRGYGASGAPAPYQRTTVYEQAQDAAALLHALGAPSAIVCGEGLGALVALDLLVRHAGAVRAAVLVDVPLLAFVPAATAVLAGEHELLREAAAEGGPEHAVAAWLATRHADEPTIARARVAQRAFFADFAGLASWPATRGELRAIAVPIGLVTGPLTAPHVLAAADAVQGLLSAVRRRTDGDVAAALSDLLGSD